jgi:hypothetical protein
VKRTTIKTVGTTLIRTIHQRLMAEHGRELGTCDHDAVDEIVRAAEALAKDTSIRPSRRVPSVAAHYFLRLTQARPFSTGSVGVAWATASLCVAKNAEGILPGHPAEPLRMAHGILKGIFTEEDLTLWFWQILRRARQVKLRTRREMRAAETRSRILAGRGKTAIARGKKRDPKATERAKRTRSAA